MAIVPAATPGTGVKRTQALATPGDSATNLDVMNRGAMSPGGRSRDVTNLDAMNPGVICRGAMNPGGTIRAVAIAATGVTSRRAKCPFARCPTTAGSVADAALSVADAKVFVAIAAVTGGVPLTVTTAAGAGVTIGPAAMTVDAAIAVAIVARAIFRATCRVKCLVRNGNVAAEVTHATIADVETIADASCRARIVGGCPSVTTGSGVASSIRVMIADGVTIGAAMRIVGEARIAAVAKSVADVSTNVNATGIGIGTGIARAIATAGRGWAPERATRAISATSGITGTNPKTARCASPSATRIRG
ncbi:MAG: hypothetical protein IT580_17875 [Verrucomicrobiales bacterium]|nr:hypothetical protein [Verrucomicrobiales bacterium]